jgi:general secretion pathway protein G
MLKFFKMRLKLIIANLKSNSGITLIEIMIVVTILAILGTLVVPRLMDNVKIAKVKAAKTDIRTFSTVLDTYYMEHNAYPTTEEGLKKLIETGKIKSTKN